jgi:hypothetical protein
MIGGEEVGRLRKSSNNRDVGGRARRFERRFEVPMLVAAVLVIPVVVIEEANVGKP